MGYVVKLQKVQRPTNRSFYVNLPAALADAVQLDKGEELEWFVEDKNTLILRRKNPAKPLKLRTLTPYVDTLTQSRGQPPDVILAGSYYILINPFRSPAIAASVRLRAPNFCMMLFT